MPIFTICTAIVPEGELEKQITGFRDAERRFTREIGVLERDFYQCIQPPHIIWSNTRWNRGESSQRRSPKHHEGEKRRQDRRRLLSTWTLF
jgi:hypothetical protein